jgi:hypothetical protein
MALSGLQPFIKVIDSNGDPIVGAVLKVYEAGTTTYRNIYSDSGLTTPLTNPLSGGNASNASGDFPRFYMASGTYKLRAETSGGVLIWEYDNIDTGLSAGVGALPISAGGTGATTAAAARANLDVPSNSELADLADDIASLSSSVQNIVSFPQGRLTLTTGTPVISSDVSAATAVYYTPFVGNIVPIYDGSQFSAHTFSSDLQLTLNTNHLANSIYDVFIYWDGSALQIATGVAWNTVTAGSGARGTGAGTTELVRVNGLWVNKYDVSYRNGATTGTLSAERGTYVGSIYMDSAAGQITCHTAWGQSRKWGVWNAYNRQPVELQGGDSTASWTNASATIRASNGSSNNSLTVFSGLPEEEVFVSFQQAVQMTDFTTGSAIKTVSIGIGRNDTTAYAGTTAIIGFGNATNGNSRVIAEAKYTLLPRIGIDTFTACEAGNATASFTTTFYGTQPNMAISARWRA